MKKDLTYSKFEDLKYRFTEEAVNNCYNQNFDFAFLKNMF